MKQIMKWGLALGLAIVGCWSLGTTAQAKSVSYQALTYGTNKSSMASKYFVQPAQVVVKHGRYTVTMHLKTSKTLGKFPVQVVSVNGGQPQNVRKVRDAAGNSNMYYSFTTTNLTKRINAKLAINVLHVYKATHAITFKFTASQLPSLPTKQAKKSHAKTHATVARAATTTTKATNSAKKHHALQPIM